MEKFWCTLQMEARKAGHYHIALEKLMHIIGAYDLPTANEAIERAIKMLVINQSFVMT